MNYATSYHVRLGTDSNGTTIPSNILPLVTLSGTKLDVSLDYGTVYYIQINPENSVGDILECPVIQFQTLGVINVFPWIENFDESIDNSPSRLPDGWFKLNDGKEWQVSRNAMWGPQGDHSTGDGNYAWVDDSDPTIGIIGMTSPGDFSSYLYCGR